MPENARITELETENATLKRQLEFCQNWMRRQVEEEIRRISRRRAQHLSSESRDEFFREHQETLITRRIERYFGTQGITRLPRSALSYLVNAEIAHYAQTKNPALDGLSVVAAYHKLLDEIVEARVTAGYRTIAKTKKLWLTANDPLEKALHLVVTKGYILSLGRLYGLLKLVRESDTGTLPVFIRVFVEYAQADDFVSGLVKKPFFPIFAQLVTSQAMGEKRHRGSLSLQETQRVRTWITGDYEPGKESLLGSLLEISEM